MHLAEGGSPDGTAARLTVKCVVRERSDITFLSLGMIGMIGQQLEELLTAALMLQPRLFRS